MALARRRGRDSRCDRDEQLVTGGVTEAVVDDLEVVEIEEQHGHRTIGGLGAVQGLFDAVEEQCAVRESRQRVVERLPAQFQIEVLAFGDVAHREHDSVDVGCPAHVGCDDLEVAPVAVVAQDPPLDRRRGRFVRQHHEQPLLVGLLEEVAEFLALQFRPDPPEHALGRRRLVSYATLRVEHDDGVGQRGGRVHGNAPSLLTSAASRARPAVRISTSTNRTVLATAIAIASVTSPRASWMKSIAGGTSTALTMRASRPRWKRRVSGVAIDRARIEGCNAAAPQPM